MIVSSYENTHQRSYGPEMVLGSFAVGGIFAYFTSQCQRIFDLVPSKTMLHGFGLTPEDSPSRISDPDFS